MRRLKTSEIPQRHSGTLGRPQRLADDVYDAILGQLMSLKIPPGGAINIDDLAREFGVSQTPIRESNLILREKRPKPSTSPACSRCRTTRTQ